MTIYRIWEKKAISSRVKPTKYNEELNPPLPDDISVNLSGTNFVQVDLKDDLLNFNAVHKNKSLAYTSLFKERTHSMWVDTGADRTVIIQAFVIIYQMLKRYLGAKFIKLANETKISVQRESVVFSIKYQLG